MGELLCDIGRKLSQLIIIDHMPAPIFGLSTFTHFISCDNKEDGNGGNDELDRIIMFMIRTVLNARNQNRNVVLNLKQFIRLP